jgi:hypothetical protein
VLNWITFDKRGIGKAFENPLSILTGEKMAPHKIRIFLELWNVNLGEIGADVFAPEGFGFPKSLS